MQKTLDNVWKALQIACVLLALGMFAQRSASGAGVESRLVAVEKQASETAQITKQTVEVLSDVVDRLRAHEIEDAAATARILQFMEGQR